MFSCKECTEFCKDGNVNCPFYKGIYDSMALCDIEKRAKEGDFPAKLYLAVCKVEGHRMEKHPVKGAWELERLSKSKEYRYSIANHKLAEGFLSFCYFEGKGVFKNEKKAFHLCDCATFTDCHRIDRKVSECNEKGIGTYQSAEISHLYLTRAAMHGDVSLMMKVGDEILNYIGDSEFITYTMDNLTISDAFFLYKTAEKNGISEGRLRIEENFHRCAPALIGHETYKKAENGDVSAQVKVGDFYISNEYHKDMREAHKWYLKAAENKNAYACFNLGCIYGCGSDNIPKDLGKAYFCYQKASEDIKWKEFSVKELKKIESVELAHLGKDESFFKTPAEKIRLAMYYMEGKAVKKDLNKSFSLLDEAEPKMETAIEKEFLNLAFEKAGDCYLENPTEENVKNAAKCYRKVGNKEKINKCFSINWEASLPQNMQETLEKAQKGDADSQFLIGLSMLSGEEFPRNTKDAEKWLLASAEQGNKLACHILGLDYYYGYSFKQDYTLAVKFLEKAPDIEETGEKGERSYLLGLCYYNGSGVGIDKAKAVQLFLKSAEAGNKYAQGKVGFCLHQGIGCDKNYDESHKWTSLAASKGVEYAIRNTGFNYEYGHGVRQDFFEAVKFYQKASESGYKTASDDLIRIGKSIYNEALKYTDKNSHEFSRLLTLSAEIGNAEAQRTLGKLMREGVKLPKQAAEGERWLCAAAEQGDIESCYILGSGYYYGKNFGQNYAKAVEFLEKIADTDTDGTVSDILATCYYNGYGTTKDMEKAAQFYHKAAEKGIFNSQVMWANCCFEGKGTPKDYSEALRWYHLTSKKDHVESIRNMGFIYEKGFGADTDIDIDEAIRLYKKAQSLGYDKASKDLKRIGENFAAAAYSEHTVGCGTCYYKDREGVKNNKYFQKALELYKGAAELGYEKANYEVGRAYLSGMGVERNEDIALKWFKQGASLGDPLAKEELDKITKRRKEEEEERRATSNSYTYTTPCSSTSTDYIKFHKYHDELDEWDKITRRVNTPGYDPESPSSIIDPESPKSIPDTESFPPFDSIW
ncbi:MAG: sel1 repeat family protein [Ruminococcaceae bacterium]|nr:sel1 repeat family protein [Oscillospiraceae bacterium]